MNIQLHFFPSDMHKHEVSTIIKELYFLKLQIVRIHENTNLDYNLGVLFNNLLLQRPWLTLDMFLDDPIRLVSELARSL